MQVDFGYTDRSDALERSMNSGCNATFQDVYALSNTRSIQEEIIYDEDGIIQYYVINDGDQKRIEFYDFCGNIDWLYDYVVSNYPRHKKWVGLNLYSNFKKNVEFFVSKGFAPVNLARTPPYSFDVEFVPPRLGMVKLNGEMNEVRQLEMANAIRARWFESFERCIKQVYISPQDLNYIRNLLSAKTEHGGYFNLENHQLKLDTAHIVRGTEINDVNAANVAIHAHFANFHTHPHILNKLFEAYILWPSSMDMREIVKQYYHGLRVHFLFSNEGVWVIQLTPTFMLFLDMISKKCLDGVLKLVFNYFALLEEYRRVRKIHPGRKQENLFIPTAKMKKVEKQFVNGVNHLTINTLTQSKMQIDNSTLERCLELTDVLGDHFKLFRIWLYKWNDLENGLVANIELPPHEC